MLGTSTWLPVLTLITTISPAFLQTPNASCLCVPYYNCDPATNSIHTDGTVDGFGLIDVRFDKQTARKCEAILDVCCEEPNIKDKVISPPPLVDNPARPKGCGIRNVGGIDFKLVGATNYESGFGEFPWTIALLSTLDTKCLCGGSLIHPQVVLTGSHCVDGKTAPMLKIRAGEWDTQTTRERLPFKERQVTQIIMHPEFHPKSLKNDIALLILETPVTLDDHINVICLPLPNTIAQNNECFASGWGKNTFGKEAEYSVIMKRVPLPIVPFDTCESQLKTTRLSSVFSLDPSFICAGGVKGIDTCQGDGGAPLACPVGSPADNRYIQNGIVAWGIGCNSEVPAVYTNVAMFRSWVDLHMNVQGFDSQVYTY